MRSAIPVQYIVLRLLSARLTGAIAGRLRASIMVAKLSCVLMPFVTESLFFAYCKGLSTPFGINRSQVKSKLSLLSSVAELLATFVSHILLKSTPPLK